METSNIGQQYAKKVHLDVGYHPEEFESMEDFEYFYPNDIDKFYYFIRNNETDMAHQYIKLIDDDFQQWIAESIYLFLTNPLYNLSHLCMNNIKYEGYNFPVKENEIVLLTSVIWNLPRIFKNLYPYVIITKELHRQIFMTIVGMMDIKVIPYEIIDFLMKSKFFNKDELSYFYHRDD